jgi:hypothetical protein
MVTCTEIIVNAFVAALFIRIVFTFVVLGVRIVGRVIEVDRVIQQLVV